MIKVFSGLGPDENSTTVSKPVQIAQQSDPGVFERNQNAYKAGDREFNGPDLTTLSTFVQMPGNQTNTGIGEVSLVPLILNLQIAPQVFSATSGQVPFETLFHDFDLQIFPFYNFWTPDELTNDRDERGERKFEDIPRFIKVSWIPAPDIPDPDVQQPKRVNKRVIKPIIFAQELDRPVSFKLKGVDFAPSHLQPSGFSNIKAMIANGYLAPGVLETVVELPLHNAGIASNLAINKIDEDAFLNDPSTRGVAVHELRGQELQLTNGAASAYQLGREGLSPAMQSQMDGMVSGKFNITKGGPGGMIGVDGVHPSSPAISFKAKGAEPARPASNDVVKTLTSRVEQASPFSQNPTTAQTKVKFYDPSIGNLVGENKVKLMSAPEHLETMVAIGPSLPNLELLSRAGYHDKSRKYDIPSLPSPRMKPLEYIGYVLEKYRRGANGIFLKVAEIDLPNREINEYIDTKVLYGEIYRYRIRAVLRWTRASDVGVMGKDKTILKSFGSPVAALSSHLGSYFYSEWSQKWVYGTCMDNQPPTPPDEMNVRPESHRKRVVVTFRLPLDNQLDVLSMRLFRKLQDDAGRDLTDWIPLIHSDGQVNQPPSNVIFYDTDVEFFQVGKMRYVYACQCISRHGESSVLSEQIAVRLNQDHYSRGEFLAEQISSAGVRLEYYGAFSTIPAQISKTELVVAPPAGQIGQSYSAVALVLTGRDATGNMVGQQADYMIRVQSLDTGEEKDIPFSILFQTFPNREVFVAGPVYVMPAAPEIKSVSKEETQKKSKTSFHVEKALAVYQDPKKFSIQKDDQVHPALMAAPGERWKR